MLSARYHRDQAKTLAALALSTSDELKAERLNLAAMEHLERAQELEGNDITSPPLAYEP
jgi:hypothetical protein